MSKICETPLKLFQSHPSPHEHLPSIILTASYSRASNGVGLQSPCEADDMATKESHATLQRCPSKYLELP